jgi:hypothetical protein
MVAQHILQGQPQSDGFSVQSETEKNLGLRSQGTTCASLLAILSELVLLQDLVLRCQTFSACGLGHQTRKTLKFIILAPGEEGFLHLLNYEPFHKDCLGKTMCKVSSQYAAARRKNSQAPLPDGRFRSSGFVHFRKDPAAAL